VHPNTLSFALVANRQNSSDNLTAKNIGVIDLNQSNLRMTGMGLEGSFHHFGVGDATKHCVLALE
jgi:hypothetical protein